MPDAVRRANAPKSIVRAHVDHVFAEQKDRMSLFIRTISIARARIKIGMANSVYNFKRPDFGEGCSSPDAPQGRIGATGAGAEFIPDVPNAKA